jgi:hypothetical protein
MATFLEVLEKLQEAEGEEVVVPDTLGAIARMIRKDWGKQGKGVSYSAKPYLDAMASLDDINDDYGNDSGVSVVRYFLSNASTWKGPVAKQVKAKLNKMCKGK